MLRLGETSFPLRVVGEVGTWEIWITQDNGMAMGKRKRDLGRVRLVTQELHRPWTLFYLWI